MQQQQQQMLAQSHQAESASKGISSDSSARLISKERVESSRQQQVLKYPAKQDGGDNKVIANQNSTATGADAIPAEWHAHGSQRSSVNSEISEAAEPDASSYSSRRDGDVDSLISSDSGVKRLHLLVICSFFSADVLPCASSSARPCTMSAQLQQSSDLRVHSANQVASLWLFHGSLHQTRLRISSERRLLAEGLLHCKLCISPDSPNKVHVLQQRRQKLLVWQSMRRHQSANRAQAVKTHWPEQLPTACWTQW